MAEATRSLSLGAFEVVAPNFLSNAWSHPASRTEGFGTLAYWQKLARMLDAGGFDYLFFADASAYPMDGDEVPEVVIREAVQFPVLDQMSLATGLAAVAPRLGLVLTASTTIERPYVHARRFSSLDHFTDGRIGWNIVTSDMQDALVKLLGESGVTPHDRRYDRASEFVDLCLHLWEHGWEEDAVRFDRANRTAIDPAGVHRLRWQGEHYSFDGYYPVHPSPQRTPTLFQAGSSPRGLRFAGDVAECVFIQKRDVASMTEMVQKVRDAAEAAGRDRDAVKVINSVSVVVGRTEEEARERRASLEAAPSTAALAAHYLGYSSINLMALDLDATLDGIRSENGQSSAQKYQRGADSPTVREILATLPQTTGGVKVTGTADRVADALIEIAESAGLDGYLIECTFGGTASYAQMVDEVIPALRTRGAVPEVARSGTLRERLTGSAGPHLPTSYRTVRGLRPGARTGAPVVR